jgi:hypothetical protein
MLQIRPLKQPFYFNGIIPHVINQKHAFKRPHASKVNAIGKFDIIDLVSFTFIVDDLVFWDGSTKMGQLGGGGSQTVWGYQTVSSPNCDGGGDYQNQRAAGIAAGVGPDVPVSWLEWLENIGVDISGIQQHPDTKTPRAWQILEQDGRRHEVSPFFFFFFFEKICFYFPVDLGFFLKRKKFNTIKSKICRYGVLGNHCSSPTSCSPHLQAFLRRSKELVLFMSVYIQSTLQYSFSRI